MIIMLGSLLGSSMKNLLESDDMLILIYTCWLSSSEEADESTLSIVGGLLVSRRYDVILSPRYPMILQLRFSLSLSLFILCLLENILITAPARIWTSVSKWTTITLYELEGSDLLFKRSSIIEPVIILEVKLQFSWPKQSWKWKSIHPRSQQPIWLWI